MIQKYTIRIRNLSKPVHYICDLYNSMTGICYLKMIVMADPVSLAGQVVAHALQQFGLIPNITVDIPTGLI